ncbi:hypothetical protein [Chlamydiifrater phoenicopteri]|uniref:hypothetical protein n=1 Tax=Chlamydiifrater phoenicopteri TaxID=2681469 RepID=UPI001BCCC5F3|nr:hypothetical protein [Chlamydiifrater phoenicopteri]
MSSPVGSHSPSSSPQPSTSEEAQKEEKQTPAASIEKRVVETFSLLQSLLIFHIELKNSSEPSTVVPLAPLDKYNIQTVKIASQQIQGVMQNTTKNCMDVAKALIALNVSLQDKLSCELAFTSTELSLLKSTLLDLREAGSSSSAVRRDSSEEAPQTRLPLKKRKHSTESTLTPYQKNHPEECPLESIKMFLKLIRLGKTHYGNFSCGEHSSASICELCLPIRHFFSVIRSDSSQLALLERQLGVLLSCTSIEKLASALFKRKELLKIMLNARYLPNHALALVLLECDIGEEICLENTDNPKTQAILYFYMNQFTSEGLSNPFVSSMLQLWEKGSTSHERVETIKIFNTNTGTTEELSLQDFANLIPNIQRAVRSIDPRTGKLMDLYKSMVPTLALFLSSFIFKTTQSIMASAEHHHLLTTTPEGELLPSLNLLTQILSLILCSNKSWSLRILLCKASIDQKEKLEFDQETRNLLHNAISSFSSRSSMRAVSRYYF